MDGIDEPVLLKHVKESVPLPANYDFATLTLPLPEGGLPPGETHHVPLWLRPNGLGAHTLHFIFSYEPTAPVKLCKRRLCPLSLKLLVQPSITLKHFLRRARSRISGVRT